MRLPKARRLSSTNDPNVAEHPVEREGFHCPIATRFPIALVDLRNDKSNVTGKQVAKS